MTENGINYSRTDAIKAVAVGGAIAIWKIKRELTMGIVSAIVFSFFLTWLGTVVPQWAHIIVLVVTIPIWTVVTVGLLLYEMDRNF